MHISGSICRYYSRDDVYTQRMSTLLDLANGITNPGWGLTRMPVSRQKDNFYVRITVCISRVSPDGVVSGISRRV